MVDKYTAWFFAIMFTILTIGIYGDMRSENFPELVEHIGLFLLYVMMWNYEVRKTLDKNF